MKRTKMLKVSLGISVLIILLCQISFAAYVSGTSVGIGFGSNSSTTTTTTTSTEDTANDDNEDGDDAEQDNGDGSDTTDDDQNNDDTSNTDSGYDSDLDDKNSNGDLEDTDDDISEKYDRNDFLNGKYNLKTEDRKNDNLQDDRDKDVKSDEDKKRINEAASIPTITEITSVIKKISLEDIQGRSAAPIENKIKIAPTKKALIEQELIIRKNNIQFEQAVSHDDVSSMDIVKPSALRTSEVKIEKEFEIRKDIESEESDKDELEKDGIMRNNVQIVPDASVSKNVDVYTIIDGSSKSKVSKITLTTVADKDYKNLEVIEKIPSSVSETLYGVKFDPVPKILDPSKRIVSWTYEDVKKGDTLSANYIVKKEVKQVSFDTTVINKKENMLSKIINWFK